MGKAYIHFYIKSFFIVQFIPWKEGRLKISKFRSRISDEGQNEYLNDLLTDSNPAQRILPKEFRHTSLIQFVETFFRFDPLPDGGEDEDNKEIILPQPYWYW